MMDLEKLARAAELEAEASQLRAAVFRGRPLPDFWRVGQKVRFVKSQEYGFQSGDVAEIVDVKDPEIPANKYQVFWTSTDIKTHRYWTTPDEVELVKDKGG